MTTEATDFSKDPSRRGRLEAILQDPVFVEALDIVEAQMEPQTGTQADAVPAMAAAKMHQVAGANELKKRLKSLTQEPREVKPLRGRQIITRPEDIPTQS